MVALTMLTNDEARAIVDRVLGRRWRDAGYDRTEVMAEDDVYGEPALSIMVWLKPGTPVIPADTYSGAALEMRDALRAKGEQRYAYLHLGRPDDPVVEDDGSNSP